MKYREDIDGLRSIAVSLVVLHHAGIHAIPGGYVGVDVFFIISGYLITSIIFNQSLENRFSFSTFYVRRIKRLMPALFTVLFVTSLLAFLFLFPSDAQKFGWSLIWVSVYLGNFFFWREHGGYFAGNTQEAPLLHTWSLAVEEQYYLLWPLYVYFGYKWLGPKIFGALTFAGFFVAIYLSEWVTQNTIGAAYYLLPTRMFELMLGSLLAIYWRNIPELPKSVNHLLSLAGISLVIYGAFALTAFSPFPGYNALYPAVGTALLILSGKANRGVVNDVLTLKPFVFVGLISYSLYLWHWPVFVFIRYTANELTPIVQVAGIAISCVLATISWKYIEAPFRSSPTVEFGKVFNNMVTKPMLALLLVSGAFIFMQGIPSRFDDNIVAMDVAYNTIPNESRAGCHVPFRDYATAPSPDCVIGSSEGQVPAVYMFGDSHANHLSGFVEVLADESGTLVQDYTMDQCPPIFDFAWGYTSRIAQGCQARNDASRQYIADNDFDFVVLAGSWPSERSPRVFVEGRLEPDPVRRAEIIDQSIEATIQELVSAGITPVLFDDVSSVVDADPKCPIKRAAYNQDMDCSTRWTRHTRMETLFDRLEQQYPQVVRVNPGLLYCSGDSCPLEFDKLPIYHDDNHLNEVAARALARAYLSANPNPFTRSLSGAAP